MDNHKYRYEKPVNVIVFNDATVCQIMTSIAIISVFSYLGYRKVRKDIRSLAKRFNDFEEFVNMA
jgi:hypothetical protein